MLKKLGLILTALLLVFSGCQKTEIEQNLPHGILENKIALDEKEIIFKIPNERVEASVGTKLFPYKKDFLLFGTVEVLSDVYSTKATLISGKTGEIIAEKDFSGLATPYVQVCNGKIVLSDWESGTVYFINEKLEETDSYQFKEASGAIYASNSGEKLYCFSADRGIYEVYLKTKKENILLEDKPLGLYPSTKVDNTVSFSYTDKKTLLGVNATIDLETAQIETIPFEGGFYAVEKNEGVWLAKSHSDELYYIGKNTYPKTFALEEKYADASMLANPSRILVKNYGSEETSMSLYAMDGTFLSKCTLNFKGASISSDLVWSGADNGYYFIMTVAPGKDILLFWDVSVPVSGESLIFKSKNQEQTQGAVDNKLYEKANEISKKYGAEVLIAEQGNYENTSLNIERIYDNELIEKAIVTLDKALSAYPEGFIKELCYGNQKKIEILLCGSVQDKNVPENATGFTSYIGYALEHSGKNIVMLDIVSPSSAEQTIYHEIMHLIDFKMAFDAKMRKNALFSEEGWAKLNPEGFIYPERTYDLPEDIYKAGYENYFVDLYSKTTPKEDRARIMEYAMAGQDYVFSSSPERVKKLNYLSDCIMDAFDTSSWKGKTRFEKALNSYR